MSFDKESISISRGVI